MFFEDASQSDESDRRPARAGAGTPGESLDTPSESPSEPPSEPARPKFSALFAAHFDYVWHALRRLGVREADLEDVTHDVFLAVFKKLDQYDAGRPLRPWLSGFAFRVASDYRERARHRFEVAVEGAERRDDGPNALERALRNEALEHARTALARSARARRSRE